MFGYVSINDKTLEKDDRDRYQALYCGLCRQLGEEAGSIGRMTLTYDMTFLAMLLSSVYKMEEEVGTLRCPMNPLRHCTYAVTEATRYAADMNLILAYYNSLDDWNDDHSVTARSKVRMLEKHIDGAKARWPRQCAAIEESLAQLGEMEKKDELNPDLPANAFGRLMGELFVLYPDDAHAQTLRRMGAALGRFIYLMDACMDLPADIRKQRYNPLIAQMDTDFTPVLTMLIGECTTAFESLPIARDMRLLRNILYSGVWVKYQSKKEGQEKRHDGSV